MVYIKIKVNQNTYDNFVTCTYILIQIPLVPYMKPLFKILNIKDMKKRSNKRNNMVCIKIKVNRKTTLGKLLPS